MPKKLRKISQPTVAHLPGIESLGADLLKIRVRSVGRSAPGKVSRVHVQGIGTIVIRKKERGLTQGAGKFGKSGSRFRVETRLDGKLISLKDLNKLISAKA